MVSVTYGVGTHPCAGCEPAWPESRLNPSLEAFRRAGTPSAEAIGALMTRLSISW